MSFDRIWDENSLSECSKRGESPVFIVSWNDHFFVLKVEADSYYIIEERLYGGCNQGFTLKFDRDTTIYRLLDTRQSSEEEPIDDKQNVGAVESDNSNLEQHVEPKEGMKEGTPVNDPMIQSRVKKKSKTEHLIYPLSLQSGPLMVDNTLACSSGAIFRLPLQWKHKTKCIPAQALQRVFD
ncbi:Hypothetical predicted protein [Olea europaea subsp. europaea]|uniref:Uncharacterized protein n=1 Tax=Olea europaea subsp. europaea TaxID=158383 RepID=A0A8S0P9B6_OLEEU|nr:Hypothetical predicted protein [Olea europaea subsp. europaea]